MSTYVEGYRGMNTDASFVIKVVGDPHRQVGAQNGVCGWYPSGTVQSLKTSLCLIRRKLPSMCLLGIATMRSAV